MSTTKTKLWLQMAMSVVLLIFSGLLLAFACKEEEKALCTLLSLAEVFMIIYQVCCVIFRSGNADLSREYFYRYTALRVRAGFDGPR